MTCLSRLKSSTTHALRVAAGSALGLALTCAVAAMPASALAQAQPQAAVEAETAHPGSPALWVVRDADSTLYLFGTVHLLPPEIEWRAAHIDAALNASQEVWMELADVEDPAAMQVMQRLGVSPDRPLSSLMTAEDIAALDVVARQLGVTAAALDPLRPWLAALQVTLGAIVKAGFDPASGVELKLKAAADEAGKPVRGFETAEQQLSYLANLPDAIQVAFLNQSVAEFDEAETQLNALVDTWAAGDVDALETVALEDFEAEYPEVYDALLVQRNADWTGQIMTMLQGAGTTFIAVGALHLAGEDSVQEMLEARGVEVERQ